MATPPPFFTEEHEIFRKSVRTFVERELLPHQKEWEGKHAFPKEIFKKLAEQGFLGNKLRKKMGGPRLRLLVQGCLRRRDDTLTDERLRHGCGGPHRHDVS